MWKFDPTRTKKSKNSPITSTNRKPQIQSRTLISKNPKIKIEGWSWFEHYTNSKCRRVTTTKQGDEQMNRVFRKPQNQIEIHEVDTKNPAKIRQHFGWNQPKNPHQQVIRYLKTKNSKFLWNKTWKTRVRCVYVCV